MDLIEQPMVTPCGHCFCKDCIETVLSSAGASQNKCPICRSNCTAAQLRDRPEEEKEKTPAQDEDKEAGGTSTKDVEMASKVTHVADALTKHRTLC